MNVIMILTDQHNPEFSGCYGGITRTQALDRLAGSGVCFDNAYTNYPICAPSRASMFTGRYVHETGFWDNATAYDGTLPNWARHFKNNGVDYTAIGKLDYMEDVDHGIGSQINVKLRHNIDVTGLFRDSNPACRITNQTFWDVKTRQVGTVMKQDKEITDVAVDWIRHKRPKNESWLLGINYFKPHPAWKPLPDIYEYYKEKIKSLPEKYHQKYNELNKPEQAQSFFHCGYTGDDASIPDIHAAYHATVDELDSYIGSVLDAIDDAGIRDECLIIYTSDHGEMARAHGSWGKISLYEDSIRVPLIISGPGIREDVRIKDPVSLIDIYPTINHALGLKHAYFSRGTSLMSLACNLTDDTREDFIFSESHMFPRITGSFAIRHLDWKLIYYIDHDPMLFNLKEDPQELNDLIKTDPKSNAVKDALYETKKRLFCVCCPQMVDERARAEQKQRIKQLRSAGTLYTELNKRKFREENSQLISLS